MKSINNKANKPLDSLVFNLGNTNAFYQTHYRSLGYNSKYCPVNEALSNQTILTDLTKETIYYFCIGAREAMRQNNFDRPCCSKTKLS